MQKLTTLNRVLGARIAVPGIRAVRDAGLRGEAGTVIVTGPVQRPRSHAVDVAANVTPALPGTAWRGQIPREKIGVGRGKAQKSCRCSEPKGVHGSSYLVGPGTGIEERRKMDNLCADARPMREKRTKTGQRNEAKR